ncbi:MAG: hypothetical protein ACI9VR_003798, partial [Cognaticolwellia sp.]
KRGSGSGSGATSSSAGGAVIAEAFPSSMPCSPDQEGYGTMANTATPSEDTMVVARMRARSVDMKRPGSDE